MINKDDTAPKKINATNNANRIIRQGLGLKEPPFLPTPMTALNAFLIKISSG